MSDVEKTCPRCAETIKAAAVVCRYCGHEFGGAAASPAAPSNSLRQSIKGSEPPEAKRKTAGRFVGLGCAGVLLLAVVLAIAGHENDTQNILNRSSKLDAEANAMVSGADTTAATDEAQSGWSYDTERDQVRGKNVYYATIQSDNQVDFGFPYAGGSTLTMTVRKHPQYGQDVIFHISKGQFVCGVESCSGTINYGNGPQRLSLNESGDYDPQSLFASNGAAVIAQLKSADKVIVELPFYQEGDRQFTFATKGLRWPPNG